MSKRQVGAFQFNDRNYMKSVGKRNLRSDETWLNQRQKPYQVHEHNKNMKRQVAEL